MTLEYFNLFILELAEFEHAGRLVSCCVYIYIYIYAYVFLEQIKYIKDLINHIQVLFENDT
jgi:hypothetical protein